MACFSVLCIMLGSRREGKCGYRMHARNGERDDDDKVPFWLNSTKRRDGGTHIVNRLRGTVMAAMTGVVL